MCLYYAFTVNSEIFARVSFSRNLARVATVREKLWKMKNFPGQGKVRELHFQSGKFKKDKKSHRKVREFQFFFKKDAS